MSNLKVNTLQNINGVEVYTCKAWVNFNGTGTVAIRGSGNVSSITDEGTGNYKVNLTNALSDTNYSVVCTMQAAGQSATTHDNGRSNGRAFQVSSSEIRFTSYTTAVNSFEDTYFAYVAVFR
jgi:hypothetical protein